MGEGWIGVDLDGTLAEYHEWEGVSHIGSPIEPMLRRVKNWLSLGLTVKIVTARVSRAGGRELARKAIQEWCIEHIGQELEVTCSKDYDMIELWDDRAVTVETNTGRILVEAVEEDDE